MDIFTYMNDSDYEQLIVCQDASSNLKAIIAIHDTTLGPALGGARMWTYETESAAMKDALRLAKGMTYKNAAAGSVIWSLCSKLKWAIYYCRRCWYNRKGYGYDLPGNQLCNRHFYSARFFWRSITSNRIRNLFRYEGSCKSSIRKRFFSRKNYCCARCRTSFSYVM